MKERDKPFDATLGYRPPPRDRSGPAGIPAAQKPTGTETKAPLAQPESKPQATEKPKKSASRRRRVGANILLTAGFVVILAFSVASMLSNPYVVLPMQVEPDIIVAASEPEGLVPLEEEAGEEGVRIEVANILQEPELPNGCEATALAILLNHYEYGADKMDIADNYLPRGGFWQGEWGELYAPDPEVAYPGAPGPDSLGYYCYPGVIVETANRYITAREGPHAARDLSGSTTRKLRGLLDEGVPVIVWCTTDLLPRRTNPEFHWYFEQGGEPYYPYSNMHAMVLTGYDSQNYYFCDPLDTHNTVPRGTFDENYIEVGRRAVALYTTEKP